MYTIISLLFFLWLVGFIANFGGSYIHALLVLAVALFLFQLITGRQSPV
ncbi:MAG: lmo0937 family membrane protein [Cyanobacteria bacterium REEB67]|nr:lmo0937 family membrane protein [Cyanobacteria bacterium REEB67]